ncbi:centrosomal protein of 162 kDa isoform X2 [Amia ocellicauda]|uniref:centrosomal protein of 162 kDa isoform X2 n=1 Tax=Amia ocellicauda TaxID=2972642 RepID=UPI00346406BE
MSRRLTKEELDEQFEQFLKESVSDDSLDLGGTKRTSVLDSLVKATETESKNPASRPWWNSDEDDNENPSARGMLGTGRSFLKSMRSSQPIEEENEEQLKEKKSDQEPNPVSFTRDSLEPEESVMASGPGQNGTGFGMDTLDEEEEKARFFANLERGASSTIDYSKLNKDLDSTDSTVITALRNGGYLKTEKEQSRDEMEDSKSASVSPNYSEDFEDEASGKEVQDQKPKGPVMLAKVSLLDSLESTAGAQKQSPLHEKAREDIETNKQTAPTEPPMTGTASYGQSGASDIEALQEAYSKINDSLGESIDREHNTIMSENLKKKSSLPQMLEDATEMEQHVTTTESDLPTAEELMRPIGLESGFARGFALQVVSENGPLAERMDDFSNKMSLVGQHMDSAHGGQRKQLNCGLLCVSGEAVTDSHKRIADQVEHLMEYVDDSKISRLPKHSSPVHNKSRKQQASEWSRESWGKDSFGREMAPKQMRSYQTKSTKKVSGTSPAVKTYGFSKGIPSANHFSSVSEKKTLNQDVKKIKLPAKQTNKSKGTVPGTKILCPAKTEPGVKMGTELIASVQSFAAFLQQQIDTNTTVSGNTQHPVTDHSDDFLQAFPGENPKPGSSGNLQREISLLKRAEEAQERCSAEHSLAEKLRAELIQKEKEQKIKQEELRLAHGKEVFQLKQENYILQTKLHSMEEEAKKKKLIFGDAADPVTEEKLKLIEKDVKEQEVLIQGYHQENEKLYRQVKELQAQNKLNEDKMFQENQRLMTELALTNEQMTRNTLQKNVEEHKEPSNDHSFSELLVHLRAAQKDEAKYLEEIRRLKQDKQSLEVDLELMKKERDLAKAQVIYTSGDKTFEKKIMEEQYKQEVADLKKRLQWYAENQELLDKDALRLKAASTEIEKLKAQVEKLSVEVGNRNIQQQRKMKERVGDARRIQDLERQVKEMEEIIKRRHPNSLPALIYAAASATAGEGGVSTTPETAAFLERRVKRLEAELEGKDEAAKMSLRAMEQQYQKIKIQYEQRISDLEQLLSDKLIHERVDSEEWALKAKSLEEELGQLKKVYQTKENVLQREIDSLEKQLLQTELKVTGNHRESPQRPGKQVEGAFKKHLDKLNKELTAKNKTIQELSKTVEKLQRERRSMLSGQTADGKVCENKMASNKRNKKDPLPAADVNTVADVVPFPATLDEKDYQPHAFAGLHISEVLQENERLKSELEHCMLGMDRQRVEMQAAVAQAESEARRAQDYAAEHVSSLKAEHQKDLEHLVTQHALEHSSSKVAELTNKLSTQEIMIEHLREQVNELHKSKEALAVLHIREETLQSQMAKLLEELKEAKEAHSPELKHFSALERQIKNMEMRHLHREQELQQIIMQGRHVAGEEQHSEVEKWKKLAQLKTRELEAFRVELDSILDVLRELQRQGVVIPAPSSAVKNFTELMWRT